ncbi:MAG: 50S ribosomal protein L29 [Actinobacteria bacterium]|nr:50S ribosomal protein L29 [Actinomycetota bacterium]
MKTSELRNLTFEELQKKLKEARQELFNLRFQLATGQLKNYKKIKEVKKDIARILTVIKEIERASKATGGNK